MSLSLPQGWTSFTAAGREAFQDCRIAISRVSTSRGPQARCQSITAASRQSGDVGALVMDKAVEAGADARDGMRVRWHAHGGSDLISALVRL